MSKIHSIWTTLEEQLNKSFYLSWFWMENWLTSLPKTQKVQFVYLSDTLGSPIACFFICYKTSIKHKIIYAKRGYLNKTGDDKLDSITIEHNGILGSQNFDLNRLNINVPQELECDELVVNCIAPDQNDLFDKLSMPYGRLEEADKGYKVDLEFLKNSKREFLSELSRNKRSQIRRSIRAYEAIGPIRIEIPRDKNSITEGYRELKRLHQQKWIERGRQGSFANQFFDKFHSALVDKVESDKYVNLLKLWSGEHLIGVLYIFLYNDTVYFYQSGFNYLEGNQYRPGLVAHTKAIEYYAEKGYKAYDFMAGESDYKTSLSNESYPMSSYRLRNNKLRFNLEDFLREKFKKK